MRYVATAMACLCIMILLLPKAHTAEVNFSYLPKDSNAFHNSHDTVSNAQNDKQHIIRSFDDTKLLTQTAAAFADGLPNDNLVDGDSDVSPDDSAEDITSHDGYQFYLEAMQNSDLIVEILSDYPKFQTISLTYFEKSLLPDIGFQKPNNTTFWHLSDADFFAIYWPYQRFHLPQAGQLHHAIEGALYLTETNTQEALSGELTLSFATNQGLATIASDNVQDALLGFSLNQLTEHGILSDHATLILQDEMLEAYLTLAVMHGGIGDQRTALLAHFAAISDQDSMPNITGWFTNLPRSLPERLH